MKKRKKYIKYIVKTITILLCFYTSLNLNRSLTKTEELLKDFLSPINKLLIKTTFASSTDQTESYLIQKNINITLEQEITELKKLLDLNKTHVSFEKEHATVIARNNLYWLNAITIDKGKKDGIEEGMAVITTEGLIGKISKVTNSTSEVKLLTSSDITYKTSVILRVNEKDYYAISNGYDSKKELLKVVAVDKNIELKKGDVVLTSGLGNMPQGLYIGTVDSYEVDNYNLSKIVYVKTTQNFNNINYVTVLKEKKE